MTGTHDAMSLVGELYAAINRDDLSVASACYADDCRVELSFAVGEPLLIGRAAVRAAMAAEAQAYAGALEGGHRVAVRQIGGIETGWGWVRADFTRALRDRRTGVVRRERAYSFFWIEDGAIRRQRTIVRPETATAPTPAPSPDGRTYPVRPMLGVGGILFNAQGAVLLVLRKHEPLALQWSLPGGLQDAGETLEAGTAREVLKETGLVVEVGPLVEVFDRILLDEAGQVRYHYVLADYLCRPIGGTLCAESDVSACAWVPVDRLAEYTMAEKPRDVIARALTLKESLGW